MDEEAQGLPPPATAKLDGLRVLVTRPAAAATLWCVALERAGATVIVHPTTVVMPPPSWAPLDQALARLHVYDWLVFTSAAAVAHACSRWPVDVDPAALSRPQIAAVGNETARALTRQRFRVAFVPEDKRQEGLVAGLIERLQAAPGGAGAPKVLFPRALEGRDYLIDALSARGVAIDLVPVSQTVATPDLAAPGPFDVSTFASPSALAAYVERLGTGTLMAAPCVVIGATTAEAARAFGLAPVVSAAPNIEAVIDAIAAAARPRLQSGG